PERALPPPADDEVGFPLAALERLEHPHAEDGAGRAGHADNEPPHSVSSAIGQGRWSGSRTRVTPGLTRGSIALRKQHFAKEMDCRGISAFTRVFDALCRQRPTARARNPFGCKDISAMPW